MKYFKLLNADGNVIRLDKAETNVSAGEEITEEEYYSFLPDETEINSDVEINIYTTEEVIGNLEQEIADLKNALTVLGVKI